MRFRFASGEWVVGMRDDATNGPETTSERSGTQLDFSRSPDLAHMMLQQPAEALFAGDRLDATKRVSMLLGHCFYQPC
jgi:hypothetical protein